MLQEFQTSEKLILARNFRAGLKEGGDSSFSPEHLQSIHANLCRGLEHKDGRLKSGELRVAQGAASLLGNESQKIAVNMMGSDDKRHIAERAAYAMSRVDQLQPFHSLNSMVGKLYSHNLAQTAGFNIDWPSIDKESLKSSMEDAKNGDKSKLSALIETNLKPMFGAEQKSEVKNRLDAGFAERATSFVSSHGGDDVAKTSTSKMKVS